MQRKAAITSVFCKTEEVAACGAAAKQLLTVGSQCSHSNLDLLISDNWMIKIKNDLFIKVEQSASLWEKLRDFRARMFVLRTTNWTN